MAPDSSESSFSSDVSVLAARLAPHLKAIAVEAKAKHAKLDDLIRDAETWLHRRAAWNARDKALYRTGAALEPRGGHLLNDIQLSGLDALGAHGVRLLAQVAIQHPDLSLSELIAVLFASNHGSFIADWGRWSRLHWLAALHAEETETFLASKTGSDLRARWRTRPPTRRQIFLADEISRALGCDAPNFANRGAAFDWIHQEGGNPRFWELPPTVEKPS